MKIIVHALNQEVSSIEDKNKDCCSLFENQCHGEMII